MRFERQNHECEVKKKKPLPGSKRKTDPGGHMVQVAGGSSRAIGSIQRGAQHPSPKNVQGYLSRALKKTSWNLKLKPHFLNLDIQHITEICISDQRYNPEEMSHNPSAPGGLRRLSVRLLISAQVMIPALWDRALPQAPC